MCGSKGRVFRAQRVPRGSVHGNLMHLGEGTGPIGRCGATRSQSCSRADGSRLGVGESISGGPALR